MAQRTPPIALKSEHFRNSPEVARLVRCLNDDAGHLQLFSKGDAVHRIHQALQNEPGIQIDAKEFDSQTYGSSTEAAVRKFKGPPRNILQPGQKTPDPIVGMRTLEALDTLMDTPGPRPAPKPTKTLEIVPFNEPVPMLMAEAKHDPRKSDLTSTTRAPTGVHFTPPDVRGQVALGAVSVARALNTAQLEQRMKLELQVAGPAGATMLQTFINNDVPSGEITFGFDNVVTKLVETSAEFLEAKESVRSDMTAALAASATTNILDYHVLRIATGNVSPPSISFGVRTSFSLKFAVGSAQGIRVLLEDFEATQSGATVSYKATVIFEIFDHFGADDDDLITDSSGHGSPGQIALWLLQRERHPRHFPFVPKIMISSVVTDTL